MWRVDNQGNLTVDGRYFRIKGGSWTGLEGRQEPSDDVIYWDAAPMEMYMGNVFWAKSNRTYDQDIAEFKEMGFNLIRLPVTPQTLDSNNPQGRAPFLKNNPAVVIENSRLALETVIKKLDEAGIYVLLDIHSCSSYVGWRAGRLDARPPYIDRNWYDYYYMREDCSCAGTDNPSGVTRVQPYDEAKWLADLGELAGLGAERGVPHRD